MFDDCLIISGANLSKDYFSARQDRYLVIEECSGLAAYYEHLVDTVATFSLELNREGEFESVEGFHSHPYQGNLEEFVEESSGCVRKLLDGQKEKNKVDMDQVDTVVFPSVQMGQLGINQDSEVTSKVLRSGATGGTFHFATGYFNLTNEYMEDLLGTSGTNVNLLMAHPQANGFLGARGLIGGIPHAYTFIAQTFRNMILSRNQQQTTHVP